MSAASKAHLTPVERARACWSPVPEWVMALAEACMHATQKTVGDKIGYSGTTVSQVISNSYPGDIENVEARVRGALMSETVFCPAINGELGRDICRHWQRRPFSTASANAVRMYQACRSGCPNSRLGGARDEKD